MILPVGHEQGINLVQEASPSTPLLDVRELEVWRGEAPLFSNVELTLDAGEALFVAGRNGAGKSSLLRTLCGLGRPTRGEIHWSLPGSGESAGRELLFIGHHNGLREAMSGLENLTLYQGLAGRSGDEEECYRVLARFGLAALAEQPVRLMSQGQRRRVALCRLLLQPTRRVWVLDEPYTSLDRDSIDLLDEHIAGHLQAGGAAIITSHHSASSSFPSRRFSLD